MTYDNQFREDTRTLLGAYIIYGAAPTEVAVSKQFFAHRGGFDFLEANKPFRVSAYDRIIGLFNAHWPDDLEWPDHIRRIDLRDCRAPAVFDKPRADAEA